MSTGPTEAQFNKPIDLGDRLIPTTTSGNIFNKKTTPTPDTAKYKDLTPIVQPHIQQIGDVYKRLSSQDLRRCSRPLKNNVKLITSLLKDEVTTDGSVNPNLPIGKLMELIKLLNAITVNKDTNDSDKALFQEIYKMKQAVKDITIKMNLALSLGSFSTNNPYPTQLTFTPINGDSVDHTFPTNYNTQELIDEFEELQALALCAYLNPKEASDAQQKIVDKKTTEVTTLETTINKTQTNLKANQLSLIRTRATLDEVKTGLQSESAKNKPMNEIQELTTEKEKLNNEITEFTKKETTLKLQEQQQQATLIAKRTLLIQEQNKLDSLVNITFKYDKKITDLISTIPDEKRDSILQDLIRKQKMMLSEYTTKRKSERSQIDSENQADFDKTTKEHELTMEIEFLQQQDALIQSIFPHDKKQILTELKQKTTNLIKQLNALGPQIPPELVSIRTSLQDINNQITTDDIIKPLTVDSKIGQHLFKKEQKYTTFNLPEFNNPDEWSMTYTKNQLWNYIKKLHALIELHRLGLTNTKEFKDIMKSAELNVDPVVCRLNPYLQNHNQEPTKEAIDTFISKCKVQLATINSKLELHNESKILAARKKEIAALPPPGATAGSVTRPAGPPPGATAGSVTRPATREEEIAALSPPPRATAGSVTRPAGPPPGATAGSVTRPAGSVTREEEIAALGPPPMPTAAGSVTRPAGPPPGATAGSVTRPATREEEIAALSPPPRATAGSVTRPAGSVTREEEIAALGPPPMPTAARSVTSPRPSPDKEKAPTKPVGTAPKKDIDILQKEIQDLAEQEKQLAEQKTKKLKELQLASAKASLTAVNRSISNSTTST